MKYFKSICIFLSLLAILPTLIYCDYGVFGYLDGEFDLRVCPGYARADFCDKKRDLLWMLKQRGQLWGLRCRKSLRSVKERVCGGVLRNSNEICYGENVTTLVPNCRRACRALFPSLNGDCTMGNKPRERCICYIHKIKTTAT